MGAGCEKGGEEIGLSAGAHPALNAAPALNTAFEGFRGEGAGKADVPDAFFRVLKIHVYVISRVISCVPDAFFQVIKNHVYVIPTVIPCVPGAFFQIIKNHVYMMPSIYLGLTRTRKKSFIYILTDSSKSKHVTV